jgi:rhombotail lipoprotein
VKKLAAMLVLGLVLAGCASLGPDRSSGVSASLVDFLYPKGEQPGPVTEEIPHLVVPLTVGLAFVPAGDHCDRCAAPSGALQAQLLERVKDAFKDRSYVREIKVIPEAYLRAGKGFTTLEQLSRLYGFDVIALVSYDQVAMTNERTSSLLYWTLVGAYVVKGNQNDVHTFVDTAVLDVRTHKLLLRAPGIDVRSFNATMVGNGHETSEQQGDGLRLATDRMIANLGTELDAFRARIKADNSVIVSRRGGGAGGNGGAGALAAPALGMLLAAAALRRRRTTTGVH